MTEFDLLVQKLGMTAFISLCYLYFVFLLNSHSSLASGALRLIVFCLHLVVVLTMG